MGSLILPVVLNIYFVANPVQSGLHTSQDDAVGLNWQRVEKKAQDAPGNGCYSTIAQSSASMSVWLASHGTRAPGVVFASDG